jgi:hypothetical protein
MTVAETMKPTNNSLFLTLLLFSLILSACAGAQDGLPALQTEAAQIVFQWFTETAAAAPPTATSTEALPTPTLTPEIPTTTPPSEDTPPTPTNASGGGASTAPCLRASYEMELIPDGSQFFVNTYFTKGWRLKNTGTCNWTPAFNAVWVHGDLMGADSVVPFTTYNVPPGGYANIYILMQAPSPAGHYTSYWMLRSADGIVFGVGRDAKEWFWVDIVTKPGE